MHQSLKNKILLSTFVLAISSICFSTRAFALPIFFGRGDLMQVKTAEIVTKTASKRIDLKDDATHGLTQPFRPWAEGIYNKTHFSKDTGFNAYSEGFAAGLDMTVTDTLLLGAGYGYTKTKVRSELYKTNIYSDTYFLYGKYQPLFWYTSGILSYGRGRYNEDRQNNKDSYHVNTYHAQLRMGYDRDGYDTYSALRYTYVNPDNIRIGNNFIEQKNSQVLTGVIGARIYKNYEFKGAVFKPELRIAALYDFKSNSYPTIVTIPSTIMTYRADGRRLKRLGGEFGAGLTTLFGPIAVSLNYDIEVRSRYVSQTGMIDMQYHF